MNSIFAGLLDIGVLALALFLFLALTLACEAGFLVGRWRGAHYNDEQRDSPIPATLLAGMLSLFAFILGLTINFAQNRYETRHDLVNVEATAIDTAWLRARMVGGAQGNAIADLIEAYAEDRLKFTTTGAAKPQQVLIERSSEEEARIWALATTEARNSSAPTVGLLVMALNQMFDAAQSQRFAFVGEPPDSTLDMLMAFSILAIGAIGFQLGVRRQRHTILTSLLLVMWTAGMVVTVDLGRPIVGQIQVDPRPLQWTLGNMKRTAAALPRVAPQLSR